MIDHGDLFAHLSIAALCVMLVLVVSLADCRTRDERHSADRPVPIRDQSPSVRLHLIARRRHGSVIEVDVQAWLAGDPSRGSDWSCLRPEWWIDGQKRERIRPRTDVCSDPYVERQFPRDSPHTFDLATPDDFHHETFRTVGVTLWNTRGQSIASDQMEVALEQ